MKPLRLVTALKPVLTEPPEWATVDARMVNMSKNRSFFALAVLVAAFFAGAQASAAEKARDFQEFAAQSRPRVTIHPRRRFPSRDAKRHCQSWLAKEYRVSGPVIVPQQQCWWQ